MVKTLNPFVCLALLAIGLVLPSDSPAAAWAFSKVTVEREYRDADFDAVIRSLEPILEPGQQVNRTDSLFALRTLGVVFASNPKTREKGRYCWFKALEIDAKADLVDLFVGEEIDRLWERTRLEFKARPKASPAASEDAAWLTLEEAEALQKLWDEPEIPKSTAAASPAAISGLPQADDPAGADKMRAPFGNERSADLRPYWRRPGSWIAAAVTAGVVGFTVYYTLGDTPPPQEKHYHVSKEVASAR